eukprot:363996_1
MSQFLTAGKQKDLEPNLFDKSRQEVKGELSSRVFPIFMKSDRYKKFVLSTYPNTIHYHNVSNKVSNDPLPGKSKNAITTQSAQNEPHHSVDTDGKLDNHPNNIDVIQTFDENDTTALENEIIRNEWQYQMFLNDTAILEAEIITNERLWREHIANCSKNSADENKSRQPANNEHNDDDNDDNKNHNDDDSNNGNGDDENNDENNDEGKDDKKDNKKDEKDEKDEDKDDKNKNKDEKEPFNMSKLKEKIKSVKATATYKTIQNSVKYALIESELMAIVYYCDSKSACSKMKKAHRCIIKDVYWQETYYKCT